MQNRFGFKDFVTLSVLFVVGILVFLLMLESDRVYEDMQGIKNKMSEIEKQVAAGGNQQDLLKELSALKTAIATRPININLGGISGADVSVGSDSAGMASNGDFTS